MSTFLLGLVIGALSIPVGVAFIIGVEWLYRKIKVSGLCQLLWYKGLWYHCCNCRRLGCTLIGCRILYWKVTPIIKQKRQWPLYCRPCARRMTVYSEAAKRAKSEQVRLRWLWRDEAERGVEYSECHE